jgi:hypothetical protein
LTYFRAILKFRKGRKGAPAAMNHPTPYAKRKEKKKKSLSALDVGLRVVSVRTF